MSVWVSNIVIYTAWERRLAVQSHMWDEDLLSKAVIPFQHEAWMY